MPEFRSDEWTRKEGKVSLEVSAREMVDIWVSCTSPVQVCGVRGKEKTILKSGTEFRFRGHVKGYETVEVIGTPKVPFGLKAKLRPLMDGEPNSGIPAPVLQLPEPGNLVLKMRQMAAAHHRSNRMPVLEPEDGPSFMRYELDDDEEALFEEEAYEKRLAERKAKQKAEAEAKERRHSEAKGDPISTEKGLEVKPEPQGGDVPQNPPSDPPAATAAE